MRWLCLDPGAKRTGVAISSPDGGFAMPLLVLQHGAAGPSLDDIASLMREYGAEGLVIGLPLSMDGSSSCQTLAALRLARRIAAHLGTVPELPEGLMLLEVGDEAEEPGVAAVTNQGIRVLLWDERLTSWEAQRVTAAGNAGARTHSAKARALDAHAAAVILQGFLESQATAQPQPDQSDAVTDEPNELFD